jgi:hypothetical protein
VLYVMGLGAGFGQRVRWGRDVGGEQSVLGTLKVPCAVHVEDAFKGAYRAVAAVLLRAHSERTRGPGIETDIRP